MSWAPHVVEAREEPVGMTMLRCARCERRWLAPGDRRADAGEPCPYCDDGVIAVLGVHRC